LVRTVELDRERAELLDREDERARRAHLRDLLDRDERQQGARADAAMLLVEHDPEEPVRAVELDDVPRELGRAVDLRRPRRDPVTCERPHELANLALLRAQRLV